MDLSLVQAGSPGQIVSLQMQILDFTYNTEEDHQYLFTTTTFCVKISNKSTWNSCWLQQWWDFFYLTSTDDHAQDLTLDVKLLLPFEDDRCQTFPPPVDASATESLWHAL